MQFFIFKPSPTMLFFHNNTTPMTYFKLLKLFKVVCQVYDTPLQFVRWTLQCA